MREAEVGRRLLVLARKRRGHGELDPAAADRDEGTDLEQAQRAAGGLGERGVPQPDPAQRAHQDLQRRAGQLGVV